MKKLLIILGCLLAIVAVNPGGIFKTEKHLPTALSEAQKAEIRQEAYKRAQQSAQSEMILSAQKRVQATLKDSNSATFKDVRYGESDATGPAAYGFVNSKNSFGAYTGFQRFISNGRTVLLEEEDNQLSEAWAHIASSQLKPSVKAQEATPTSVTIPAVQSTH